MDDVGFAKNFGLSLCFFGIYNHSFGSFKILQDSLRLFRVFKDSLRFIKILKDSSICESYQGSLVARIGEASWLDRGRYPMKCLSWRRASTSLSKAL